MRVKTTIMAFVSLLLAAAPGTAGAVMLQQVGGSFPGAIFVTSDPGNPERLLVAERDGRVLQFERGVTTVLADFEERVSCCEGEQGLLSIAPAPDFHTSRRLYVDYTGTETPSAEIHVAELVLGEEPGEPFVLRDLLKIPHPEVAAKIHYGGQLQLGPEGDLFVSTGDGGPGNDGNHTGQDLESRLGKILRVKPNPAGGAPFYEVPADNPFVAKAGAKPEIWSYGLRNPFRFSFDPLSGAMLIGDVGQAAREEVDYAPTPTRGKGANYGWNCREGLLAGPATDPQCASATGLTDPVFDYAHAPGGPCAIIGGYVARDPTVPELYGRYVYGDFCTREIRSLDLSAPFAGDQLEAIAPPGFESFGEDAAGRLYVVAEGAVYRLASPSTGLAPATRTFAHLGIRAIDRRVERGGRATITVFVSPCAHEKARTVTVALLRGNRQLERRHLNPVCTARFRPRIPHRTRFRARLVEDAVYFPTESRRLTIKPQPRHRHRR
jgi:glucose/arabinose dehydrogenase